MRLARPREEARSAGEAEGTPVSDTAPERVGVLASAASLWNEAALLIELPTRRMVQANREFFDTLAYAPQEVIGRTPQPGGWWPDVTVMEQFIADAAAGGVVEHPIAVRMRDGSSLRTSGRATVLQAGEARHLQLITCRRRDIGPARLEHELMFKQVPVGVALTRNRAFVHTNPAFDRIFGWVPGRLAGQPGRVVWSSDEIYADIGRRIGPGLARGEAVELESTGAVAAPLVRRSDARERTRLRPPQSARTACPGGECLLGRVAPATVRAPAVRIRHRRARRRRTRQSERSRGGGRRRQHDDLRGPVRAARRARRPGGRRPAGAAGCPGAGGQGRAIDLVLMDPHMPVTRGLKATRLLRMDHDRFEMPIIGLSAAAFATERADALAVGMNDFVVEPIEARRLERAFLRAVAQHMEVLR